MTTPQDFDFDAWLEGAERPERAVTVYQRASLIADLDALEAQIIAADEDGEDVDGPSVGGGVGKLRAEYAKLARQFHESALTFRVQGRDEAQKAELVKANGDAVKRGEFGYVVLADAIMSPRVTAEQLKRLAEKVGEVQFNQLAVAYQKASNDIPAVSADFLPKRSTPDDGGES
jgi:hypothetical protein